MSGRELLQPLEHLFSAQISPEYSAVIFILYVLHSFYLNCFIYFLGAHHKKTLPQSDV